MTKTSLHQKILAITIGASNIKKSGYNSHQKYHYSTEADIYAVIKPLMEQYGVAMTVTQESVDFPREDLCCLKMKFTFTDVETGENIQVDAFGLGQDKGDKSLPKAATTCLKYAFMKLFMISGEDDVESDGVTPPKYASQPKPQTTFNKPSFSSSKPQSEPQATSPKPSFNKPSVNKPSSGFKSPSGFKKPEPKVELEEVGEEEFTGGSEDWGDDE